MRILVSVDQVIHSDSSRFNLLSTLVLIFIHCDLFPQDFIRNGVVISLLIFVHTILSMFHFWARKMKISGY